MYFTSVCVAHGLTWRVIRRYFACLAHYPIFGHFSILFLFYSTLTKPHFSHVMHTIFRHFMMYLYSIWLSQLSAMCSIMHARARYLYIMILVRDSFRTDSTLFYSTRVTFLILSIVLTTYNHAKRWKKYNKKHYNDRHFRPVLTGNVFYWRPSFLVFMHHFGTDIKPRTADRVGTTLELRLEPVRAIEPRTYRLTHLDPTAFPGGSIYPRWVVVIG